MWCEARAHVVRGASAVLRRSAEAAAHVERHGHVNQMPRRFCRCLQLGVCPSVAGSGLTSSFE